MQKFLLENDSPFRYSSHLLEISFIIKVVEQSKYFIQQQEISLNSYKINSLHKIVTKKCIIIYGKEKKINNIIIKYKKCENNKRS